MFPSSPPPSRNTKAQSQLLKKYHETQRKLSRKPFPSPYPSSSSSSSARDLSMSPATAAALPGGMRPPAGAAAEAHQSRLLYELCALLLTIMRSPEDGAGARPRVLPRHVTPAGVASMLLGASMALMLCGSVTFMLGFFLMPWVLGLGCVFLFVGFVTNLSGIGKAILLWTSTDSSPKETYP
ncbi:hypothetical protein EJB05_42218, partial [Eragrostis curvula]